MTEAASTGTALAARVAERHQAAVQARLDGFRSRFGDEPLAWLALVPIWAEPLAREVGFQLPRGMDLSTFLDVASTAGLIEREPERRADPDTGRAFWIGEADRTGIVEALRGRDGEGADRLREIALAIADRLATVPPALQPESVREWATVAARLKEPYEAARSLRRDVQSLANRDAVGEASARVDAGQRLARAIGGPLVEEAQLGARRVELAYRRSADERHLRHYVRRQEQIDAFDELLAGSRPWALHYLGMGGVGKTMLLRDLTSRYCRERGFVVTRIDFDHLSPQFPARRPGQLLLALAAGLRGTGTSTQTENLVNQLSDRVLELHEILNQDPPPGQPLYNVERGEFDRILYAFCDLLRTIPSRVVLLLDTCEELSRIPIDSGILPSLEATFSILTRVHQQIDSVRVVFAGRRPIASSGEGWRLDRLEVDSRTALGQRQAVLRHRDFLLLHEVRGLTRPEAETFLRGRLSPPLDDRLLHAMIDASPEPRRTARVVRTDRPSPGDGERRFTPFDLALYADWRKDDPTLSAERIQAGDTDPYVDLRIAKRMEARLRPALPAIAALGRFDLAMLRPALPAEADDAECKTLFAELADFEWLDVQAEGDTTFLDVDRQLLPRLRRYFEQPARAAEYGAATAQLGPALVDLIGDTPLDRLGVTQIDAALAILPAQEAARLWVETLLRVPTEASADWLRVVTERLRGDDGAGERQPTLSAGLEAAGYIVGRMTPRFASPVPAPLVAIDDWPDDETRDWFLACEHAIDIGGIDGPARAVTALSAAVDVTLERARNLSAANLAPSREKRRRERMLEEESAALIVAAEWIATRLLWPDAPTVESERLDRLRDQLEALTVWGGMAQTGRNLEATTLLTIARLALAGGNHDATRDFVSRALEVAQPDGGGVQRRWLHWVAPEHLLYRIRLQVLSLQRNFAIDVPQDVERWWIAPPQWLSIDGERLASAIIRWRLYRGVVDVDELMQPLPGAPAPTTLRLEPRLVRLMGHAAGTLGAQSVEEALSRVRADIGPSRVPPVGPEAQAALDAIRRGDAPTPPQVAALEVVIRLLRTRSEPIYRPDRQPVAAVHADVPPLFVSLAMAAASQGQWKWADDFLADVSVDAERSRRDPETVRIAALTRMEIALQSREAPRLPGADRAGWEDRSLQRAQRHVDALVGRALSSGPALDWHDLWRTTPTGVLGGLQSLEAPAPFSGAETLSNALDYVEGVRLGIGGRINRFTGYAGAPGSAPLLIPHLDALLRDIVRAAALAPLDGDLPAAVRLPRALRRLAPFSFRHAAAPSLPNRPPDAEQLAELEAIIRVFGNAARASGDAPSDLVVRVGPRRLLLIAIEEGELLALRLPQAAAPLLDAAYGIARRLNDHVSAVRAATSAQLARTAADAPLKGRAFSRDLEPAWRAAAGTSDRLIAWEELPSAGQDALSRAWVLRAHIGLLAAKDRSDATLAELTALGTLKLPGVPELLLDPPDEETGKVKTPTVSDGPARPPRFSWSQTATDIGMVLAGLLAVAVAWRYSGSLRSTIDGAIIWTIGSLLIVLALVRQVMAGVLASRSRVRLRVDLLGSATLRQGAGPIEARMSVSGRHRYAQWGLVPATEDLQPLSFVATLKDPWRTSYHELASAIDGKVFEQLDGILERLESREGVWPIQLEAPRAAWIPWEAVLTPAIASRRPMSKTEPFLYRVLQEPRPRHRGPWFPLLGGVVQIATPGASGPSSTILRGWMDHGWAFVGGIKGEGSAEVGVAYALGTPVLTVGGARLRLGADAEQARAQATDIAQMERAAVAQDYFDSTSLSTWTPLVVLQQLASDAATRLASDREQAGMMRAVAEEVAHGLCGAVIVIPSLPGELAEALVDQLARALRTPPMLRPFLTMARPALERRAADAIVPRLCWIVQSLRQVVLDWPEYRDPDDPRREAAWDICLYVQTPEDVE